MIACDLTALDAVARRREQELLRRFPELVVAATPIEYGYDIELPSDTATMSEVGEFLALERRCCPFLRFQLTVDRADRARLRIDGPEGTREFIEATFLALRKAEPGHATTSADSE